MNKNFFNDEIDSLKKILQEIDKLPIKGIFFYDIHRVLKSKNIKQKLFKETQQSLEYAQLMLELFDKEFFDDNFDYSNIDFAIHVDAGQNGKTREVIPEIVEWVKACGFECETKPDSFVASSIADKYSK